MLFHGSILENYRHAFILRLVDVDCAKLWPGYQVIGVDVYKQPFAQGEPMQTGVVEMMRGEVNNTYGSPEGIGLG